MGSGLRCTNITTLDIPVLNILYILRFAVLVPGGQVVKLVKAGCKPASVESDP